jgi:hypothetical protein
MKKKSYFHAIVLLAGSLAMLLPALAAAQSTGSIEFTARVTPSGGQPEPVRQLTFYLLRKSMEDIRAEALQSAPAPDLDKFVDGLGVTPELKAWMKLHHSVRLTGDDFTKSLTPGDIVDIPEFFAAYMTHNEAYRGAGFPEPKFKEKDRLSNPDKYKAQKEEYKAAVRKFILGASSTKQGMDLELTDLNPYPKWLSVERKQNQNLETSAFRLAEERYVVGRADSNLEGHGSFAGVPPGKYWIGMFGAEAVSGDVHLHWDLPVMVRPGATASVQLSNLNAAPADSTAENSTH